MAAHVPGEARPDVEFRALSLCPGGQRKARPWTENCRFGNRFRYRIDRTSPFSLREGGQRHATTIAPANSGREAT